LNEFMNPNAKPSRKDRILGGLWGAVVGDALGVPVEFISRQEVQATPVTDMWGHGTHHQEPGTWSDDGALLVCTVDSLLHHEFDTEDIGRRFLDWYERGLWAARGEVFDVGLTTSDALIRIRNGIAAEQAGGRDEHSNGNGSLMRILPVALRFADEPVSNLLDRVGRASAITHGHERCLMACGFYALVVNELLAGAPPSLAAERGRAAFSQAFAGSPELKHFDRISEDLYTRPEDWVVSTGYVIDTLTASLWCLLTTNNYRDSVVKAVNLGGDTDTTGCVAGGLAGAAYGVAAVPQSWIQQLARRWELEELFNRFSNLK
jgi:ADP-ribosylglycohydrolase